MGAVQHEISGRDRILLSAQSLFADHGFHQTSMSELATDAKVSVGQIYRFFKGKEEIIDAIVRADGIERLAEMRVICEGLKAGEISVEQGIEKMVLSAMSMEDEALSFDILAEASRNETVGQTMATLCIGYREMLREFACVANPALSGEALDAAEEVILACLFGLGHRSLSMPRLSVERTATISAQMIVAALKSAG